MKQESYLLTGRSSKKLVFRCDDSDIKRLKQIALDHNTTLNALLIEGVKLIFQKYEKKKIKNDDRS